MEENRTEKPKCEFQVHLKLNILYLVQDNKKNTHLIKNMI